MLTDAEINELLNKLQASHKELQTLLKKLYTPKRYDLHPQIWRREAAKKFWAQKINGHFHTYIPVALQDARMGECNI